MSHLSKIAAYTLIFLAFTLSAAFTVLLFSALGIGLQHLLSRFF